jgi:hypothetical protein
MAKTTTTLAPSPAPRHHAPAHVRAHEPPAPAAPAEPERTVKEGRIVDPFAGMK